jgi:hypothetical protein
MHAILGGMGNIDQLRTSGGEFFEGASLRLFDREQQVWRIYWADSRAGVLFPPVMGVFDGPFGVFRGNDVQDGVPVQVEFHWDRRNPEQPVWHQAFSADGGATWETNWIMKFRRPLQPAKTG